MANDLFPYQICHKRHDIFKEILTAERLKAKALLEALEFVRSVTSNSCDKADIIAIKSVVETTINNYKNSK